MATVTDHTARAATPIFNGRPRILGVDRYETRLLDSGWTLCSVSPDAAATPKTLASLSPRWRAAVVPGTVAMAYRDEGTLDLDRAPDFDATDWWYRCRFESDLPLPTDIHVLCLDGLATLADVWVNGTAVLSSEDMFVTHEVDITASVGVDNEILIRFRSLRTALDARRPRPRWKTRLVEHQQLRWHRATLLGRMPGWSPSVRAVGPWRPVRVERRAVCQLDRGDLVAVATEAGGIVNAALVARPIGGTVIHGATLHVGAQHGPLAVTVVGDTVELRGAVACPDAEHWWPHTHGAQPRYGARVVIHASGGDVEVDFGHIAFRRIDVDQSAGGFAIAMNGVPIFCRGACWTTPDIISLGGTRSTYRHLLMLARDAGMNMLRIGGTMVYESDDFYDVCDELGILVWQDFMFANMDYPAQDALFAETVAREVDSVLARLRRHPSVTVLCGNSEVEQQAAMLGVDRALWTNPLFSERLPQQCALDAPGVPYWPSSPSGGVLPFHVNVGVAHYYGVGAYLRPLEDARRAEVRFTTECLGFSNVPDPSSVEALLPNGEAAFHHPRWKARVPRDHGTGWDFEDVRDHYLAALFGVDPIQLRYADMDRYLALSRVTTGEVMERTIGEWRRGESTCRGALVWFFQDLWMGAGWGVVDAGGRPKAAYYALKRAMQPVASFMSDEGTNGLRVHVANDHPADLLADLHVALIRSGSTEVAAGSRAVRVPGRSSTVVGVDDVLGRFVDSSYAYRFGPPGHDAVVATLRNETGGIVSESVHFPMGMPMSRSNDAIVSALATRIDDVTVDVTVRADRFAQSVAIDCVDFVPDDNYFHMVAGSERIVRTRATRAGAIFAGFVQPLNGYEGVRVTDAAPNAGQGEARR